MTSKRAVPKWLAVTVIGLMLFATVTAFFNPAQAAPTSNSPAQPVSQAAAPAKDSASQQAKPDPNKVVDGIACRDVSKFGIDKQMNIHASLIMAGCGLTPAAAAGGNLPRTGGNMAMPANYGGTDVDVILPDGTPPHITQSESFVWGHGSTVVVNYNDSRNAASTCYSGVSYSLNGGTTWVAGTPLCAGHGSNFGDPTVVWDNLHNIWVATDLASGCGGQGVGAWRSPDGITWTPGGCAMNSSSGDRNSSWVDNNPSSPHYGTVYSSYNDFAVGGGALYVSRSTDGGVTWLAGVQLNPAFIRDVQLTGAADGTVLEAAMNEGGGGLNPRSNVFYRSTDGGATFTQVYVGPTFYPAGRSVSGYFAGMYNSPSAGYFRYMSWGQPAGGGPQIGGQNVFHYVYSMGIQGTDPGNVMYIRSTNNGVTWSAPLQLNTDTTTKAQFMPSLSETSSGALMATWYDERNNTYANGACTVGVNVGCYEWFGRVSLDNGATWQADMPVSDAISPLPAQNDPNIQPLYVGDYNYASADGNTAYTTWTDGRTLIGGTSQQDVYFDKVPVPVGTPTPTVTGTPPTATPTSTNTSTPTTTPTPCFGPNPVVNGGFETGTFAPWVISDTIPPPMVVMTQAHSGTKSAFLGSLAPPEPNGSASIYQTVTVPAGSSTLSYWYYPNTTDTITFDWQDAYIENSSGTILAVVMHVAQNTQTWTNVSFNMTPYAGQTVRIVFLVHQDGFGDPTGMYVDDVAIQAPVSCATNTPGGPTNTPSGATATPTQCVGTPAAWVNKANIPTTRTRPLGVYYPTNDKFYLLGGRTSDSAGSDVLNPTEYTLSTDTWITKTATFTSSQVNNMAGGVLTISGTPMIVAVGGSAAGAATATSDVRLYNPVTDILTTLSSDPWPGNANGTTLPGGFAVANNKLYILGGFNINVGMTTQIWEFDPARAAGSKWALKTAALPVPLGYVPAAAIGGIIYTGGGSTFTGGTLADSTNSYAYNPTADTIAPLANQIPRATGETRAVAYNGKLWVLGGGRTAPNPSNEVDIYDPGAGTWSVGLPFNNARRNDAADTDGTHIFLAGGYAPSTATNSLEVYYPAVGCATPTPIVATATPTQCAGGGYRILIAYADLGGPPTTLRTQIQAEPGVAVVDLFDAANGTPTLAQLQLYDEVVTFTNNNYNNPTAMGNVIADYQDGGGVVVVTTFAFYNGFNIAGRWQTGGYSPFNFASSGNFSTASLGSYIVGHPLMNGVTTLSAFFRVGVTTAAGATQVATYTDGVPLASVKTTAGHTAVGINAYLGQNPQNFSGQWGTLIVNAVRWLKPAVGCGTPTVTATPVLATATPTQCAGGVGTWQTVAPGPLDLYGPGSASDGTNAYFAGGYSFSGGGETPQFAKYNVGTNTWTTLAPMSTNGAVEMPSANYSPVTNKVYVMGGGTSAGTVYNTNRIFDVAGGTWTTGAPMPDIRGFAASGYYNGNIYIVGGYTTGNISPAYTQTWQYNIAANTWTTKTGIPAPLGFGGAGSTVINGHLYVAGGRDSSNTTINTLWDYNIATDAWTQRTNMPAADNVPGAATLNGKLYIFGGGNPFNNNDKRAFNPAGVDTTNATMVYDPSANSWSAGPNLNQARSFPGGTTVGNTAVTYGGYTGSTTTASAEKLSATACGTPTTTPTPSGATATPTQCAGGNAFTNGGFETGTFAPWVVQDTSPAPAVSNAQAHTGTYSAHLGSLPGSETPGDSSIYQTINVPAGGGTLSYWYWPRSVDSITFDWQDAYVVSTTGTILATIMHVNQTTQAWTNMTFNMGPYAGQTVRIKFLVHGDNAGDPTDMYVDDVSLAAPGACGTPTTTPTAGGATATPTQCVGGNGNWQTMAPVPSTIARYAFVQNGNNFYVIGGVSGGTVVQTLYAYNAVGNTWTTLPPAPAGSFGEAPTAGLYNGNIYVVGGSGSSNLRIFSIAAGTWTNGPNIPRSDTYGAAGAAYNGKFYVAGGGSAGPSTTVNVYDITAGTWSTGTAIPSAYLLGGYTQVGQYLYMAGSYGSSPQAGSLSSTLNQQAKPAAPAANSNATMRMDLTTGTTTAGPVWTMQRADFGLASDGTSIYAIGGDITGGGYFDPSAEVDSLNTSAWPAGTWAVSPPALPTARQANQAGFWRAGQDIWSVGAYVGGQFLNENLRRGTTSCGTPTTTPTPSGATATPTQCAGGGTPGPWIVKAPFPYNARGPALASDGTYVYASGGYDGSTVHMDNYRYNPVADTWTLLAPSTIPHFLGPAVYGNNGNVYVMGGFGTSSPINAVQIYNIAGNSWTAGAPMPATLSDHAAAYYNGKVYVAGGYNGSGAVNTLYIYDITANSWTTGAPLPAARYLPGFGIINGKFYFAGGADGGANHTEVYIYDITAGTWTTGTPLPTGSTGPGSAVVNGKLWVIGGGFPNTGDHAVGDTGAPGKLGAAAPSTMAITQIYDPATSTWTNGPAMNVNRLWFYAAVAGSAVVATGGDQTAGSPINDNEVSLNPPAACGTPTVTPTPSGATATPTQCAGGGYHILLAGADAPSVTLRGDILAEPGVTVVDTFDARTGTPTLSQLQQYDEVVAWGEYAWQDATAMGNVLADYQDGGGVVVVTTFAWDSRGGWMLSGRWMTGGYTPFNTTTGTAFSNASLGSYIVGHPLMNGVTTLTAFYRNTVTLAAGATQVATYTDGLPLAAVKTTAGHTAVGLNAYLGDTSLNYSGQWGKLIVNAARWLKPAACGTPTVTPTRTATPTPGGATATPTQCVGGVGTWTTVAPGPLDLYGPGAASDGTNAYFAGGYSFSGGGETPQFAKYNVGSNTWTTLAPMSTNGAVEMASANYSPSNNKVYVMGGGTAAGTVYNTNRIFDVAAGTWTTGAPMPDVRGFAASGYFNGKIYIVGGYTTGNISPAFLQTWEYNIAANTWLTKTSIPAANGFGGAGSAVINGHLYVAGGRDSTNTVINTLWDYNIAADSWTQRPNMSAADNVPGAATLNGKLYVFGGGNPFNNNDKRAFTPDGVNTTNATMIYDPTANSWSAGPNLNQARSFPGGTTVGSTAVAYGGYTGSTTTASTEVLNATVCGTPTPAPTNTATLVPTSTATRTNTPAPPTATNTSVPVATATNTSVPVATATNTSVPVATATNTPAPVATSTNTPAPIPSATATDCPNRFVDINGNVFYFAIHYLACRGVVVGIDGTHYAPYANATRAQFAKVVVLGFSLPLYTPTSGQSFTDVPPSHWAYTYIESGYHDGILTGYDAAGCAAHNATYPCFLPEIFITRAQVTKLVVLAGGYQLFTPTGGGQDFTDVPPSHWAYVYIETAYHNGIINGYPDGTFRPNLNIQRDEMAQIVYEGIIHRP